MKNKTSHFTGILGVILIFLFSFIVFTWTHHGEIIDGNDTTYPLSPLVFFKSRLFQWNETLGAGIDFSHGSAGITWHGAQALLALTGIPISVSQKLFLFILFNVIAFSIYYFFSVLFPKSRLPRITGTIFYLFNPYVFNLWGNIQSSNLCAYAFIPLTSAFFLKALLEKNKVIFWAVLSALCSIVFSSIGMNPQVAFVVFLYFLLFITFIFVNKVLKKKEVTVSHFLKTGVFFSIFYLLFNSFWIIPETITVFTRNLSLNIPTSGSLVGWLDFLSKNTSAINVFRLQGEWMWFESHNNQLYIPFANFYQTNPFLLIIGFLSIFVSIFALAKSKSSWSLFFGLILFLGLFLSMGTKPPFGYPFLLLVKKISILSFLRSPWYKFSLLTTFSFAVLAACFIDLFSGRKKVFLFILIVLLQIAYAFPLLTGQIFPTKIENAALPFKFEIPDYVWQADNFLRADIEQARVVVLPRQGDLDYYQWGGNSSTQLLNLLSSGKSILNDDSWTVANNTDTNRIVRSFYDCLYSSCSNKAAKILSVLNVKYLVLKNDFAYDYWGVSKSPSQIAEDLVNQTNINKTASFGLWDIYSIEKSLRNPVIFASDTLDIIDAEPLRLTDYFLAKEKISTVSLPSKEIEKIPVDTLKNFYLTNYSIGYQIKKIDNFFPESPYSRFLPSSPLYRFVRQNEENDVASAKDSITRVERLVFYGQKRLLELKAESVSKKSKKSDFNKLIGDYLKDINSAISLTDAMKQPDITKIEVYQTIVARLNNSFNLISELKQGENLGNLDEAEVKTTNFYKMFAEYIDSFVSSPRIKKFVVEIRKDNYYDILLKPGIANNGRLSNSPESISLNGEEVNSNIEISSDGVFKISNLFIKNGANTLNFKFNKDSDENFSLFLKETGNYRVLENKLPGVEFTKIDPTKYTVKVKNATQPFLLVFSENFHLRWQAFLTEKESILPISDGSHLRVNSYANGWLIDKTGDFGIVIEYRSQKSYRLLLIFTVVLLGVATVYVLCKSIRIRRNVGKN